MISNYTISIKRLVMVDSAGFSYIEIPLDEHAILLAEGNVGKSSVMNSLRLFLLPEENLRKSEIKFGFRTPDKSAYYTNEQSYNHYFPSNRSFLILEVENSAGTHCQILYRGDGASLSLGYKRIFIPVGYDMLRETFWDTSDPEGIGFARPELSVKNVINRGKELSKETDTVSDKKSLINLLYSNDLLNKANSQYAVLPMASVDKQKIESLRTLIRMLFEVSHDSKSMAMAVANIIENQKNYERDRFDFDIGHFLDERDELESIEKYLNKIKSERPRFVQLNNDFKDYNPRSLAELFTLWCRSLQFSIDDTNEKTLKLSHKVTDISNQKSEADRKCRDAVKDHREAVGTVKSSTKKRSETDKYVNEGRTLISSYPESANIEFIRSAIKDGKSDIEKELEVLENSQKQAETRQRLISEVDVLKGSIQRTEDRIANSHLELKSQLPNDHVTVLSSINGKLASANPGRELTTEEFGSIEVFCGLFERHEDLLRWFDVDFAATEDDSVPLERILQELRSDVKDKERQLKQVENASADPAEKARQINNKNIELKGYIKDLEILNNFEGSERQLERLEADLINEVDERDRLQSLVEVLQKDAASAASELENTRRLLDAKKADSSNYSTLFDRLQRLGQLQPKLLVSGDGSEKKNTLLSPDELVKGGVDDIERQCFMMGELRDRILRSLCHFIDTRILFEEHEALRETRPSNEEIRTAWSDLKDVYSNLDHRVTSLEDQRRTHNGLVENYRTSLRKNRDFIKNVQGQLNRRLESVQINDLAEIRVEIECDEAFESLVRQSEQINEHSSQSLSDAFYDQLKTFMNKFFDNKDDGTSEYRLTMEKVVKKISYQTRKKTDKHFDDKAQSNSTTSLINLSLVQGLLKSLLDQGYNYSLPAVLDEVASVDIGQIASLLERIRSEGFRLFGAATHSASSALVLEIGRHFKLDEMRTARPYDVSRDPVYWGGPEGVTEGPIERWIHPEQQTLMDEALEDASNVE